jgi:hypothetical protein
VHFPQLEGVFLNRDGALTNDIELGAGVTLCHDSSSSLVFDLNQPLYQQVPLLPGQMRKYLHCLNKPLLVAECFFSNVIYGFFERLPVNGP